MYPTPQDLAVDQERMVEVIPSNASAAGIMCPNVCPGLRQAIWVILFI